MKAQDNETNSGTPTDQGGTKSDKLVEGASQNRQQNFQIKLSTSVHQALHPMIVPVSFNRLPIYINELWITFCRIGGAAFGSINSYSSKYIFIKVMLILAEAKVCCAQRQRANESYDNLPQKELYYYEELIELNSLVKELPYPLVIYLDCLGNTMEGELNVTPVLVELEDNSKASSGAISYAPRQLLPLLLLIARGMDYDEKAKELEKQLKALPKFQIWYDGNHRKGSLAQHSREFWLTADGRIRLTDSEISSFQKIIKCFDNKGFNVRTDILNGKGSMAQTVQTPEWFIDRPFRYFCMANISEYDQKLGAIFGFSFNSGCKVQESRYEGSFKTAYWRGEVMPQKMMKSILDNQQACVLQEEEDVLDNQQAYVLPEDVG